MSSPLSSEMEHEFELENELSQELENELEHEVSGAHELEHEHAQEGEHEAFFNSLAAMGDRGGRSQALRRIALTAARAALRAQRRTAPAIQGELEFEAMPELELEFSPSKLAALPGQMEHMGHAAAEAETEQEAAEHFLPLIGLAAKFVLPKIAGAVARKVGGKLISRVAGNLARRVGSRVLGQVRRQGGRIAQRVGRTLVRRVQRNVPQLNRAVANVTRTLWRNKTTRPLLHAIPHASRRTMVQMARYAARGRPISPRAGVRLFARNTARYIANPRLLSNIYRRSVRLDSRYHRHNRRIIGHPTSGVLPASAGSFPTGAFPTYGYGQPVPGMPGMCTCPCRTAGAGYIPGLPGGAVPVPSPVPCPSCGRSIIG